MEDCFLALALIGSCRTGTRARRTLSRTGEEEEELQDVGAQAGPDRGRNVTNRANRLASDGSDWSSRRWSYLADIYVGCTFLFTHDIKIPLLYDVVSRHGPMWEFRGHRHVSHV